MDQDTNQIFLVFEGVVASGAGRYSDMTVPGKSMLSNAPDDWPEQIQRGSLNVVINEYPEEISKPVRAGDGNWTGGMYCLDDGHFSPTLVIPGELITGNILFIDGKPSAAQVWRATLEVADITREIPCWVMRRFGSQVGKSGIGGNVVEIVSREHLRTKYDLKDGMQVSVIMRQGRLN